MSADARAETLLEPAEQAPYECVNTDSAAAVALVCEHAGRAIPRRLGDLGIAREALEEHIAWDIGAASLARAMAERLAAPLLLQPYSRLVVDCNRPTTAADAMPAVTHGVAVPANTGLTAAGRACREREIFAPFHDAVSTMLDARPRALLLSVHSFTPTLGAVTRPWQLGLLFNRDDRAARALMSALRSRCPTLAAAFNQPYSVDDASDWTIPVHGEQRGIAHVLVEVRNDLLQSPSECASWADLLAGGTLDILPEFQP